MSPERNERVRDMGASSSLAWSGSLERLEVWERTFATQVVAASCLLSCAFVHTLEDRGLFGHARASHSA